MKQSLHLAARAALAATLVAGSLFSVANATEAERRASARAPGARAVPAESGLIVNGLEQLGWEAAMIDSSVFGQLRLLRDFEPRLIETPPSTGTTEACR